MDEKNKIQLQQDFESYMHKFYAVHKRFNLEDFGVFVTTLLNHYVNNHVIELKDKKEAAYFMTSLYNKGIGNRITEEHLQAIAQTIAQDYTVDFAVIQFLFT